MPTASNWWVNTQPGPGFPGGAVTGGGGSIQTAGAVQYRNPLDAARTAVAPYAQYPDGYLGTITDRREDKLLNAVQERLTERSYQRGVHKGEKISNQDYFWSAPVDPEMRLKAEAKGVREGNVILVPRYTPTGNPVERLAHQGKTAGLSAPEQLDVYKRYGVSAAMNPVVNQDPGRKERLMKMLPNYAR